MSFWKKIGGAFVDLDEDTPSTESGSGMSDDELEALLSASGVGELTSDDPEASAELKVERTPLDWTLAEVFVAGGVATGRNSAEMVLTLLHGLAAIPEEQRLIAIRAMDLADDGWDEETVLADAAKRLQVLKHYGTHITTDETDRVATVNVAAADEQDQLAVQVADVDAQIAQLQGIREEALAAIASSKAHAEDGAKAIHTLATGVRNAAKTEAAKYTVLLAFFGKSSS
jgi:hypothetical protein